MTTPAEIRCWQCGVEPLDIVEVTTLAQRDPEYLPGRWPAGDHPHAVNPPTPSELADRGDASRARTLRIWAE